MKFDGMTERELDAFWRGTEAEQDRINKLLEQYIAENPKPIQEALRRRLAFVKGLVNDKDAWNFVKGEK
jgi:hypothetical protein